MAAMLSRPQCVNMAGLCSRGYRQVSYISRTLVGNKIVDNSDALVAHASGMPETFSPPPIPKETAS